MALCNMHRCCALVCQATADDFAHRAAVIFANSIGEAEYTRDQLRERGILSVCARGGLSTYEQQEVRLASYGGYLCTTLDRTWLPTRGRSWLEASFVEYALRMQMDDGPLDVVYFVLGSLW